MVVLSERYVELTVTAKLEVIAANVHIHMDVYVVWT